MEGDDEDEMEFEEMDCGVDDLEMLTEEDERAMRLFASDSDKQQPSFGDIVFEKIEKLKKIKKWNLTLHP